MHVIALCATCGRHFLLERSLRLFLEQDYQGKHTLLIYNNSPFPQQLGKLDLPDHKQVILYNQFIDSQTGEAYKNLGAIYNDILHLLPEDSDIIIHWDDDDLFLPNHITEGIKGFIEGGTKAYKPSYSWYRHRDGVVRTDNNLEPSIFVKVSHILQHKYSLTTTQQHLQWLHPLIDAQEIFVKVDSIPTLIYNWGDIDVFTYKTSGRPDDPNNFNNCRTYSMDHGDQLIEPWPVEAVQKYYKQVENVKK